jgi:hypothetical protein
VLGDSSCRVRHVSKGNVVYNRWAETQDGQGEEVLLDAVLAPTVIFLTAKYLNVNKPS